MAEEQLITQEQIKEEKMIKRLRFVVLFMGVLLVIAMIILIVKIFMNVADPSSNSKNSVKANKKFKCVEPLKSYIPIDGNIRSYKKDGNIVVLSTGKELIIYDLCLNQIRTRFSSSKK